MIPSKFFYMMCGADLFMAFLLAMGGNILCMPLAVFAFLTYYAGEQRKSEGK